MLPSTDTRLGAIERRSWSLRRITSGSSWIPEIDGLRFVAIVLVMLFHLSAEVTTKSGTHFTTEAGTRVCLGFSGGAISVCGFSL
jgi:peptidoglycan/LPS O-acetylase OafA/YrhL